MRRPLKYYQVVTACPSSREARKIARTVVEERLAGCAQVYGPIASTYWWQGKIEDGREWLCVMKCVVSRYRRLESRIAQLHSYTLPEILAVPIAVGNLKYLEWLAKEAGI
jgi:periplasmic divalent cation tolerance protein